MLFPKPRQPDQIFSHWFTLLDGFELSPSEFYQKIETEIAARRVPGLKISRVDFHEGGLLSDKRTYLRLARERYAFDVCAAPFGRTYFFSLRFVEKPRGGWFRFAVLCFLLLVLLRVAYISLQRSPEPALGVLLVATLLVGGWRFITANPPPSPSAPAQLTPPVEPPAVLSAIDEQLLNLPVIGPWYERQRKDTYYRLDTRMVYQALITDIVKQQVDAVTSAKGVKLIRAYDYNPILGELYKTTETPTERPASGQPAA